MGYYDVTLLEVRQPNFRAEGAKLKTLILSRDEKNQQSCFGQ